MSSANAIGVFDSGLGGLSAVREFLHILPNENIIYFGDTGRVPYGNRSREIITKYAFQDTNFLLENNVKMIVAACGTVSSVAGKKLESDLTIKHYLTELVENDIDTLILGCTHYPLLADAISSVIGNSIELIDSGYETALYTKKVLGENNLLNESTEQGTSSFFVSDTPEGFESVAELFLGKNMEHTVTQIDIEKY